MLLSLFKLGRNGSFQKVIEEPIKVISSDSKAFQLTGSSPLRLSRITSLKSIVAYFNYTTNTFRAIPSVVLDWMSGGCSLAKLIHLKDHHTAVSLQSYSQERYIPDITKLLLWQHSSTRAMLCMTIRYPSNKTSVQIPVNKCGRNDNLKKK